MSIAKRIYRREQERFRKNMVLKSRSYGMTSLMQAQIKAEIVKIYGERLPRGLRKYT